MNEDEEEDEEEKFQSTEDILYGEGEQLLSNMQKSENIVIEDTDDIEDTEQTEEQEDSESVRRLSAAKHLMCARCCASLALRCLSPACLRQPL